MLLSTNTSVKKAAPMTSRRIVGSGPRQESQLFSRRVDMQKIDRARRGGRYHIGQLAVQVGEGGAGGSRLVALNDGLELVQGLNRATAASSGRRPARNAPLRRTPMRFADETSSRLPPPEFAACGDIVNPLLTATSDTKNLPP